MSEAGNALSSGCFGMTFSEHMGARMQGLARQGLQVHHVLPTA